MGSSLLNLSGIFVRICHLLQEYTSLFRPQGGEGPPLLAFGDTIKYHLLQLFLHIFHGLASIYNLHQASGKRRKNKKKRKRFNMQPNLAWRPKCCKILKWQQARHLEIIETKKYYHFARLIAIITKYEYQKRTVNFRRKGQKNSPLPSRKHHEELYNFQQLSSEIPAFHISHHHTLLFLQLSDMNMQGISISKIGESE